MTDPNLTLSDTVLRSEQVEDIAPGITCEWLDNRQIVAFTMATVARTSVDLLLTQIKTILTQWPADRPYLAIYHIVESTDGPTPYIRGRFREIPQWRPDVEAHVALITARNFQGRLIQLYARTRGDAVHIFFRREEGLAWLRGFLKGRSNPAEGLV